MPAHPPPLPTTTHHYPPLPPEQVVLATKEQNVKTRGAAYDLLLALASAAEKSAPGGGETAKAEAVRGTPPCSWPPATLCEGGCNPV